VPFLFAGPFVPAIVFAHRRFFSAFRRKTSALLAATFIERPELNRSHAGTGR
jgi:hypothetical protein